MENNLMVDKRLETIREIEQSNGRLYVFGCEEAAERLSNYIESNSQIYIEGYVVDDLFYSKDSFHNKRVFKKSDWIQMVSSVDYVWCGFVNYERYVKLKKELEGKVNVLYYVYSISDQIDGGHITKDYFERNKDRFCWARERLCDDFSQKLLDTYIQAHISGMADKIENLSCPNQYFNKLTKFDDIKVIIDCGAYTGDSALDAIDFYNDVEVIAIEPDENNLHELRKANDKANGRIKIVPKGVWSCDTVLNFSLEGENSKPEKNGVSVEVTSIDSIVNEMVPKSVDLIKLDIEGSELEALVGAKNTIAFYQPLIVTSIYHRRADVFELINYIYSLVRENYSFYLRYHGQNLCDLVLYAIPNCR